jgi:uncharacterized membrane protein
VGRWIGIGLTVVLLIVVGFIIGAYLFPEFRVATRDIAIVVLAVFQMISAIISIALLLVLVYAVRTLTRVSRTSLIPKLEEVSVKLDQVLEQGRGVAANLRDTTSTVSGTTSFLADRAIAPVIRISGLMAGVRAAVAYFARRDDEQAS